MIGKCDNLLRQAYSIKETINKSKKINFPTLILLFTKIVTMG